MTKHPTNVDYALQEYTCMDSSNINNINNCKKYVREKIGGAWTDWKSNSQTITTGVEFETGRIVDGKKEYRKSD